MLTSTLNRSRTWTGLLSDLRWEQLLGEIVDRLLWTLVVLAPLAWGGRGEVARAVYAALAATLALAWFAREVMSGRNTWRWTPVYWLPIVAAVWVALQLIPLPPAVVTWLAPRTADLLPLWQNETWLTAQGFTAWHCLSLDPQSGHVSLAMLACFACVLFVFVSRVNSHERASRLMKWLAQSAILMATFGIVQYMTAGGLFFWVYEHPFRSTDDFVCGSFINQNHFASFLVMGGAAIVYHLLRVPPASRQQSQAHANSRSLLFDRVYLASMGWAAGLAVVMLALVMSASRGGALAAVAASVVLLVVCYRKQLLATRQMLWMLLVTVLAMVGMTLQSNERFTNRLADLTDGSIEKLDQSGGRRAIWNANLQAISAGWLVGAGAGSHALLQSVYLERSFPRVFTHAENGYLQVVTELGLPGLLLLLAMVAVAARWTRAAWKECHDRDQAAMLAAVLAGIAASVVHSAIDFVWYIPATLIALLLMLVILRFLASSNHQKHSPATPTKVPLEMGLIILCLVVFMATVLTRPALTSGHWHRYYAASAAESRHQPQAILQVAQSGDIHDLQLDHSLLIRKIEALREVIRIDPDDAQAHLRLARGYLQLFDARAPGRENRMALGQIQSAVASGGFTNRQEIRDWMTRAIGPDVAFLQAAAKHARRSIANCPLQGAGYICLANVAFMYDEAITPLLTQADRLSPNDGAMLFDIGRQYLAANQLPQAIESWQRCYLQPTPHRLLVVAAMAGNISAQDYLQIFEPDWTTMYLVWQRYLEADRPAQLTTLLTYAQQLADNYQTGTKVRSEANVWMWLGRMYSEAGDQTQQLKCLERAMQLGPHELAVRKAYAIALYRSGAYSECEPHLRWCRARDLTDSGLRKMLHEATTAKYRRSTEFRASSRRETSAQH